MSQEDSRPPGRDIHLTYRFRERLFAKPLKFWVRIALGIIFIVASVDKIHHPAAFAQVLFNYQLLPASFINPIAILLPWLELTLGLLLLSGYWLPGAVTLTNLLLIIFFSVLLSNKIRGVDVPCGCFDTNIHATPATTWYLIRDAGFILLAAYLFYAEILRHRNNVWPRK